LLDDASGEDLVANIQAISAGETLCSPRIANLAFDKLSQLAHQSQMIHGDHATPLTRRELEIIAAIEKGWSNKEIALGLHIEVSTVKNHIHNILEKLELRDRRSAARYVKEHGITASLS
jgi:DNA-binding NarL/FixJ family response regulator